MPFPIPSPGSPSSFWSEKEAHGNGPAHLHGSQRHRAIGALFDRNPAGTVRHHPGGVLDEGFKGIKNHSSLSNVRLLATTSMPTVMQRESWFLDNFGLRFVAFFLGIFIAANLAWSGAHGTALERLVIEKATVKTSASLISWLKPHEGIRAEGAKLISPKVRLSVLNGCEGTESVLLLASAVLAFPASWRRKSMGLLLAAIGTFFLNQIRLVALFLILRHKPEWFEVTHGYIAPLFIIFMGSLLFMGWVRWATAPGRDNRALLA